MTIVGFKRNVSKAYKAIHTLELTVYGAMVGYGEWIQMDALAGKRPHDWITGHLTDIGYAGALATVAALCAVPEKKFKTTMMIPTLMSALEIVIAAHPKIEFDWQDCACYYGMALLSYGVNRACNKLNDNSYSENEIN